MISDDQIRNLPDDSKQAFIEYVRLLRDALDARGNAGIDDSRHFVARIRAFTDSYDIGIKFSFPDADHFWDYYSGFIDELNYAVAKLSLEVLRSDKSVSDGGIDLSQTYRDQIHLHLEKVRKIVVAVPIEERLRENILTRLNALRVEVDKNRSNITRFTDVFLEITAAVGEGAENLEPVVKIMERICGIFGRARKENDTKNLIGKEDRKLITGPSQNEEGNHASEASVNADDIPF